MIELDLNPDRKNLRIFAGLQILFFAFIAWSIARKSGWSTLPTMMVAVSAIVGVIGILAPAAIRPIYVVWMLAVYPIGWIVSHVLVGAVYFMVVSPIGLLMRALGRDPLDRDFDASAATYWATRETPTNSQRYFRQF